MSDDEMPAGDMIGDMGGEMSDDDMSEGAGPMDSLPQGVQKEILTEAPPDNWKKPKKGDEVSVHYVGTLQSDGSEFDSSRSRGQPFVFTLGKGQVIKGWDVGVASMKKGELAKLTLAPEFAYGDAGSAPKIPEKATLVFEIELLSWTSKDDLFNDEGVIKSQVTEGSGWNTPKQGDEVLLSVKAEQPDGTVIEEKSSIDYTLGSDALGPVGKAVDKALTGMKTQEVAELKCTKDYAYGDKTPEGATLTLTLEQIYETKDVSFESDKSVMKKQIAEGEGYDTPKDANKLKLIVDQAMDESKMPLPGFTAKTLEFTLGNGEVCDALECAAGQMKKGEKAILTVTVPSLAAEEQLGLKSISAEKVLLTLRLEEFEKGKDQWSLSEEEKVEFGIARKEVGSNLFRAGRFALALQRYKKVVDMFSYIDNYKEENKEKAKDMKKTCQLNKAACYVKIKEYFEAKTACDEVLKLESQNVKAMYRRAQAQFGLKNFLDCIADCKRVVELDPKNRDARTLVKQAQEGQKEEDRKSKGLFANMCKALGKFPLPPPGKTKPIYDDGDDDDEDMEDGDAKQEEKKEEDATDDKQGEQANEEKKEEAAGA